MKKLNVFKRIAASVLTALMLCLTIGEVALAEELPYDTYNYNYREDIVYTPAAYVPNGSVTGLSTGTTAFKEPRDLCVAPDGLV